MAYVGWKLMLKPSVAELHAAQKEKKEGGGQAMSIEQRLERLERIMLLQSKNVLNVNDVAIILQYRPTGYATL